MAGSLNLLAGRSQTVRHVALRCHSCVHCCVFRVRCGAIVALTGEILHRSTGQVKRVTLLDKTFDETLLALKQVQSRPLRIRLRPPARPFAELAPVLPEDGKPRLNPPPEGADDRDAGLYMETLLRGWYVTTAAASVRRDRSVTSRIVMLLPPGAHVEVKRACANSVLHIRVLVHVLSSPDPQNEGNQGWASFSASDGRGLFRQENQEEQSHREHEQRSLLRLESRMAEDREIAEQTELERRRASGRTLQFQKLMEAVRANRPLEVGAVLNASPKPDIDALDEKGWSPIMCAAAAGTTEVLRELLEEPFRLNDVAAESVPLSSVLPGGGEELLRGTALIMAVMAGHTQACEALLIANADPLHELASSQETALDLAQKRRGGDGLSRWQDDKMAQLLAAATAQAEERRAAVRRPLRLFWRPF
jgi:hypothetical protein